MKCNEVTILTMCVWTMLVDSLNITHQQMH